MALPVEGWRRTVPYAVSNTELICTSESHFGARLAVFKLTTVGLVTK